MNYTRKPDGVFYDAKRGRLMEHRGYAKSIYWSKNMLDLLKREYPTTFNYEMAELLAMSERTMQRKAKELGLTKDPEWLKMVWKERMKWANIASKKLGYPGAFQKGTMIGAEYRFKKKSI